jgi:DNA polymerase-3 subunit delta'
MNINPSANTKLYGMNTYFKEIINLYDLKKMPNKIILSGKSGLGKSTLAYHIVNYILSKDEEYKYDLNKMIINLDNRSYKLLQNKSHPNFYLIDLIEEKKSIDIGQIREMITYTNKSSFNNLPRFILIDNIENLNKNSINALLKIVEEPNENIFFILIHNNEKKILPTLKSRCLTFKINFTFDQSLAVSNLLYGKDILKIINYDLISYYNTPGEFTKLINFSEEKNINLKDSPLKVLLHILIDNGYYKKNPFVKKLLINFIELFFLKEYKISRKKKSLFNFYHNFIAKIHNTEKFNLDEESLFLEFKSRLLNG